jgi:poly(A) polymerase
MQARRTAVPRRFSAVTQQSWSMQPRVSQTSGKRWKRILGEPRFRAAYDFLLLRGEEDPGLEELGQFWNKAQEDMPVTVAAPSGNRPARRPRSRRRRRGGSRP